MSHILIADDDVSILASLRLFLKMEGFKVTTASNPGEVEYFIKSQDIALALIDLNYKLDTTSGEEGLTLTQKLKSLDPDLAIICMTGWATVEIAVEVMKRGAGDFVQKPWENERLLAIINAQLAIREQKLKNLRLNEENKTLKQQIAAIDGNDLVAHSSVMKNLLSTIEQVAKTDINILITGENGTGKSLLASYIHSISERKSDSFVAVNMGAITETLFESEMFGHVKGAYTDAKENRIGRVELAQSGTLFLDEIANIPLTQQAKLLRLLEEHQFEKVGSSKTQQADIRLVSATNANLEDMVTDKSFRQDLLYRLNTFVIEIPSLKARGEDILPMAKAFIIKSANRYKKRAPELSDIAKQQLITYEWPGNVRELSHTIERATLLAQDEILSEHLMLKNEQPVHSAVAHESKENDFNDMSMDDIEKSVIESRLRQNKGNALDAAKSLGMSRSAFYRRLDKFGI
ncbi:sigma-54-dependent transcriptional regulator [Pseudoalteromonas denitrificans]|uniref:DNA-binding transcriptional response regulator, NtrC family, contains REC, AAA-type ATPase, and a Fis-type DNA-binding domains n=1 Tax=Pseudoalteromonas denitrificans DSM 6059 TaxID=1123010 RepID=A0A1I1LAV9_9GAMM|nr:sigma-54 dependent transcriptional regulator [Pseudoalteromonas denitrificans]SFC70075.1 DNA-binding transcriptional response regulator, NtrC family, contains REC, AAA-type ATPase, and a Fis-type DNA-binding domains [Pseudoalteromonas denitrificans DSM 6059]